MVAHGHLELQSQGIGQPLGALHTRVHELMQVQRIHVKRNKLSN